MNIFKLVHIENSKLRKARHIGMIVCLLMGLISAMILSFYCATDVLVQFYLGYTLLRLSTFFFAITVICATFFDKFFYR